MISFNLSLTPVQLTEGARDATVISCSSSNSYVGDFSICHSKNLTNLQRLAVDDEDCCFCSRAALSDCSKKFPNWKLELSPVGRIDQCNCLAKLKNVAEDDSGFYQCRVYDLENYPCQRRYGSIYNFSVSKQESSTSTATHPDYLTIAVIAMFGTGVIVFIVTLVPLALILCRKHKKSHSSLNWEQSKQLCHDSNVITQKCIESLLVLVTKNISFLQHVKMVEKKRWIDHYLTPKDSKVS